MTPNERSVYEALVALLDAVYKYDVRAYRELVTDDVSSFETDIAPYRIDSLDFHLRYMSLQSLHPRPQYRTDILTPRIQLYGEFAIVTYTLLLTIGEEAAVSFRTTNETRVFVKDDGRWKMAHLHRSPAGMTSAL